MKILSVFFCILLIFSCCGCSLQKVESEPKPNISSIRSICELATLECYYNNVAKSTKEKNNGIAGIGEKERKFWIEYTGVAKIGIDMSEISIEIIENTIRIALPDAKLLSTKIDEKSLNENSYFLSEDGTFNKNKITATDQSAAIQNAQQQMEEEIKGNILLLQTAKERAKKLIENYIRNFCSMCDVSYDIEWVEIAN